MEGRYPPRSRPACRHLHTRNSMLYRPSPRLLATAAVAALLTGVAIRSLACPYCTVESQTLTEEMAASDTVILATLITEPSANDSTTDDGEFSVIDPETGNARFKIDRVLRGADLLKGQEEIEAIFFGEPDASKPYFIRGVGVDRIDWNIPMPLTEAAVKYIDELETLPESGPVRLAHFLQYLQHSDPLLAQDTYDEFARAPYADLIAIADQIDRPQLWKWIEDRDVSPSRRSLFFTMLGVCGQQEDQERLRKMMLTDQRVLRAAAEATSALGLGLGGAITLPVTPELVAMEQRRKQLGFNALVGCYLKLSGDAGLDVVDEHFLADDNADPTKVYGALIALRFLAEETDEVTMDRLLQSMRLVLDKPDFAEQAITDLARWEDWTVLDRLVEMFREAPDDTYVKEPIVAYLDQARRQPGDIGQRATTALAEIEKVDPATVKRARSLLSFGFLGRAQAANPTASDSSTDDPTTDQQDTDDPPAGLGELDESMEAALAAEAEEAEALDPSEGETDSLGDPPAEALTGQPPGGAGQGDPPAADPATAAETAQPAYDLATAPAEPPNPLYIYGLPLLAAVVLMGLVWLVLRGGV